MVPTLFGRIQTRIFLLATVGVLITLAIMPLVLAGSGLSLGERYMVGFVILATVTVLGVVWEFIYHFLMQFRWEKDWPSLFGLITLLNEGVLVWILLSAEVVPFIEVEVGAIPFWIHFLVVWIGIWLFANGPMRVPFIRWRFRGGRLL
ncbi:hypothetical protein [Rhizohabitans arisaemae]|uniref:hypothetical protein n=1 Tax=Rhizohabitans arisaemae TaxID=2720610 RepID=UPI0024B1ABD7|nr:hypothetical protein [Rhizohabitans arisaemae]